MHLSSKSSNAANFMFTVIKGNMVIFGISFTLRNERMNGERVIIPPAVMNRPTLGLATYKSNIACNLLTILRLMNPYFELDFLPSLYTELLFQLPKPYASVPTELSFIGEEIILLTNEIASPSNWVESADIRFDHIWMWLSLLKHRFVWLSPKWGALLEGSFWLVVNGKMDIPKSDYKTSHSPLNFKKFIGYIPQNSRQTTFFFKLFFFAILLTLAGLDTFCQFMSLFLISCTVSRLKQNPISVAWPLLPWDSDLEKEASRVF